MPSGSSTSYRVSQHRGFFDRIGPDAPSLRRSARAAMYVSVVAPSAVADGFFVGFGSALDAVAIQQKLFEPNSRQSADQCIQVRIRLHLADVVHWKHRVHGDGLNIAARIEPLAEADGICRCASLARASSLSPFC